METVQHKHKVSAGRTDLPKNPDDKMHDEFLHESHHET